VVKELDYRKLKGFCTKTDFSFDSTKDLEPIHEIIGQDRAKKSIQYGLKVKKKGYNIYVAGASGTGKTTFAKRFAEEIAKNEPIPPDFCYVYNFEEPTIPKILKLKAGTGKIFRREVEEFIEQSYYELSKVLGGSDFEAKKHSIVKEMQEKRDELVKIMTSEAKESNFSAKFTNTGIYFMPIVNNEVISEEQYDQLTEDEKDEISKNTKSIQSKANEISKIIREHEKDNQQEIEQLEYTTALFVIGKSLTPLLIKYGENESIVDFLMQLKEDILENIDDFFVKENDAEESIESILPWIPKKNVIESKYAVNVFVDNSGLKHAPVVTAYNPTYSSIMGEIEYDNEYGSISTDFMKIKAGLLHKANGGYLILKAQDILSNAYAWETLRRVLTEQEIRIEPLKEYSTGVTVLNIKPESIELNVKIIMIGTFELYDLLYEYDSEFKKIFKVRADFDYEMNRDSENVIQISRFIKNFVDKENSLHFDATAIARIIEFSSRIAGNQNKLSTKFGELYEILVYAENLAKEHHSKTVSEKHVKEAIVERDYMLNMYEDKLSEAIDEGIVMISTSGEKIGEINALVVVDTGDYIFSKPSKITATTYCGKSGIVNIEKEVEMSGRIHDKGIQVLIGYLGQIYAQDFPLSLSCRICFEQNYSGVDGDSASSAELYAIMSSLGEIPINQQIAVTGSINQRGEIQPIGGVTYKVEGFYDLCEKRGLTGQQGVIIPIQNVSDLTLKDSVIDAVKNGLFHIYPISSVDEGIEILTGLSAGTKNEKGKYQAESIHGKAFGKLKHFNKKSVLE